MGQGLELYVWLGLAGSALGSAQVLLWRARRVLNQPRQDVDAPQDRLAPTAAATQTAGTVTTA